MNSRKPVAMPGAPHPALEGKAYSCGSTLRVQFMACKLHIRKQQMFVLYMISLLNETLISCTKGHSSVCGYYLVK